MQAADMPIDMAKKETGEPVKLPISSTIISTNGLKITSKLNPDAKEFYPAYLLRQKMMRKIGDAGTGTTLAQPLHFAHDPKVLKVMRLDGVSTNQLETDVDTLKENMEIAKPKEAVQREIVEKTKITTFNKVNNEDGDEKEEEHKPLLELECENVIKRLNVGTEEAQEQTEEQLRVSEEDDTDFEYFEDAEGEPMLQLVAAKSGKAERTEKDKLTSESCLNDMRLAEDLSDEENREQCSDQDSNDTLDEFKGKEGTESVEVSELSEENELVEEEALHELPNILEEIKETNSLCGDGDGDGEGEGDDEAVCESVDVGDGAGIGGSQMPTHAPIEESIKSSIVKKRFGKSKSMKDKEDKKNSDKRTTLRKLASISLSLRGKNSAHHTEKITSTSAMARTKRLSESLYNFTLGRKSKPDNKKANGSTRFLPRNYTNIPRPPVSRIHTTPTRARTESNDINYKAPKTRVPTSNANAVNSTNNTLKDVLPLKSISLRDQNLAAKPTTQSGKKPLSIKSTNAGSEKSSMPTVVARSKSKDSVDKTRPRGTYASTLRQTEAQKRRSLFPNDDSESNIELSQFLFK